MFSKGRNSSIQDMDKKGNDDNNILIIIILITIL